MMELGQTTMNHGCIRFGHDGITLPSCAQGFFFQMKFWFLSFSPNLLQMQYDRTTRAGRVNEPQCAHGNGYPASSRSFLASFKIFPYLSLYHSSKNDFLLFSTSFYDSGQTIEPNFVLVGFESNVHQIQTVYYEKESHCITGQSSCNLVYPEIIFVMLNLSLSVHLQHVLALFCFVEIIFNPFILIANFGISPTSYI